MDFQFLKAKNGSLTCKIDGKFYHSAYSPENEAKNFVQTIKFDFFPESIFVIEPGLSYCQEFLKKRFPKANLYAIRLCDNFFETDSKWNKVFYFNSDFKNNLLFSCLEEELLKSQFISLQNSTIFESEIKCRNAIFSIIKNAKSILYTKHIFAKKWFLNSVRFATSIKKIALINKKIDKDVIICASGPSLENSIELLKEWKNNFFIICLSSATKVLCKNNIKPDLIFSTDGGFWAKYHLQNLPCPLSLNSEGALFYKNFKKTLILPVVYPQSLSEILFTKLKIPFLYSKQNGTVSGTALEFALNLTDKNIYFLGLDLHNAKGFQHSKPNELELFNEKNDFRLSSKETRQTKSRFSSSTALEIYSDWFKNIDSVKAKRIFRLSDNFKYSNNLNNIKDVNWNEIPSYKINSSNTEKSKKNYFETKTVSFFKENLFNEIQKLSSSQFFLKEVFPLETLLFEKCNNENEKNEINKKITDQKDKLLKKVRKILDEQ